MTNETRFDWPLLMRLGLGALAMSPEVFWSMTPREFDAALKGRFRLQDDAGPMSSVELASLQAQFPDEVARR